MLRLLPLLLLTACSQGERLNPGASVPIYENSSYVWLSQFGKDSDAIFMYPPESIHLTGYFDGRSVHEYQHFLEKRLADVGDVDGIKTIRHAFRDLCGPTFEIGNKDLLDE